MNISRMYLHQCIKSHKSQSKGFSLIELMVSLSVFAIVMVVRDVYKRQVGTVGVEFAPGDLVCN